MNIDTQESMSLTIQNDEDLYLNYMPFITGGGIFVKTTKDLTLGSECLLNLQISKNSNSYPVHCRVVWVTPKGAQGGKACGVGLQFVDDGGVKLRNQIETILAGSIQSSKQTNTI